MTGSDAILLEQHGSIARITLNRPDVGNALDVPMARALLEAAIQCDEDDSVRCVLMTGAGKMFCAGGDIGAFADAGEKLPALLKEITAYLHAAQLRLLRMDKPLVTAINGATAGAGIGLAVMGDIALAGSRASFTPAYSRIGLSPDGGLTWLLPRLIGMRQAQEFCLRNRRIGCEEAATRGLVTRVVDGDLSAEAEGVARELAASATSALGATRQLLLDGTMAGLEAQFDAESRSIATLARTHAGREGIAAFIAKRAPDFSGVL